MKRTSGRIIKDAEDTLLTAKIGLQMIESSDPTVTIPGFRNVIIFGRAVTNILQNLRSTEGEAFDEWYQPKVEEMEADVAMKHLYRLRSIILKQGRLETMLRLQLSGNPMAVAQNFRKPPGARGFFFGDQIGGSGWEVETEDGSIEKFYVDLSGEIPGVKVSIDLILADGPPELSGVNIEELSSEYLNYLEGLVTEAHSTFC